MNVILILGGVVKAINFFFQMTERKPSFPDMKSQLLLSGRALTKSIKGLCSHNEGIIK